MTPTAAAAKPPTSSAMTLPVVQLDGQSAGNIDVGEGVLGGHVNKALLYQVVQAYRAGSRAGTADTKRRSEVSGGGRKPWKQKHTGRARAGSIRSPLWRHGGIVFGPHPRDFSYQLPAKIRRAGLREALRAKVRDGELLIVDALQAEKPSTKAFAGTKVFRERGTSLLVVLERYTEPVVLSLRNLSGVTLSSAQEVTAFDLINHRRVLMTKAAWTLVEQRCGDNGHA